MSRRGVLVLAATCAWACGAEKPSPTPPPPSPVSRSSTVARPSTPPASAGPYEYLFDPRQATNDNQLFLSLVARDSAVPRSALEPVLPRLKEVPSELPVLLFLASRSGRPVGEIADMRLRGGSWSKLFAKLGVAYDELFKDLGSEPGPPYSRVWSRWKADPKDPGVGDDEIESVVAFYYGRRWSGLSPQELARRAQGRTIPFLVAEKQGRPYEPGANAVLSARPLPPPPGVSAKAASHRATSVSKKAAAKRKPTTGRRKATRKGKTTAKKKPA